MLNGCEPNSNHDVASFFRLLPQRIARRGIAVAIIDHVAKAKQERGRYAVGAGHKLALVDVAYRFDLIRPGLSHMKLVKDRHGLLRESLGAAQAADLELTSEGDRLRLEIRPAESAGSDWRPTHLMERVSRCLELDGEELSGRAIEERVDGRATYVRRAVQTLIAEGYVDVRVSGRTRFHASKRPFRCVPGSGRIDEEKGQVN